MVRDTIDFGTPRVALLPGNNNKQTLTAIKAQPIHLFPQLL
jgi:hypothetical protein